MIIKEQNGVAAKLYGRQQLTYGHSMAHLKYWNISEEHTGTKEI
jgi:hypothetical protein